MYRHYRGVCEGGVGESPHEGEITRVNGAARLRGQARSCPGGHDFLADSWMRSQAGGRYDVSWTGKLRRAGKTSSRMG